jgi:hypothetical protein
MKNILTFFHPSFQLFVHKWLKNVLNGVRKAYAEVSEANEQLT